MFLSPTPRCSHCTACTTSTPLSHCQACAIVHYCNRAHQVAHRPAHKIPCNAIKKTRNALSIEETRLRSIPPDLFMPANVFETHAGHFWGIHETRPYMRARYALVEALLKVKTYAAVAAAHAHLMDMLRLCRGDNMGVRSAVPALYLRLGREQECYDFCVWYATEGQKGDYDWGDMELPYLDVKGADVLGLQEELLHKYADLNHSIAVVLLKIRLHSVVWSLWESYLLADKVPRDILLAIQDHILSGSVLAHRKELVGRDTQAAILETLRDQIKSLYNAVQKQNQYFWPALLKPGKHLTARPEYTSSGTIQEMELVLSYNYDAWMETPGALDMVRRLNGKNSDM